MTPTDLADTIRAAGVSVVEAPGWQTRGRPGKFAPVGIMVHHTAGARTGDAPTLGMCIRGRPDLAGPLCHIVLARSGTAHVIAAGVANHAGTGSSIVLDKVRMDVPPDGDARLLRGPENGTGNVNFWGIECENQGNGVDPYPEGQLEALLLICAAVCRASEWTASRVIHHREWTRKKIDMSWRGDLRGLVDDRMKALAMLDCPYGDA